MTKEEKLYDRKNTKKQKHFLSTDYTDYTDFSFPISVFICVYLRFHGFLK